MVVPIGKAKSLADEQRRDQNSSKKRVCINDWRHIVIQEFGDDSAWTIF